MSAIIYDQLYYIPNPAHMLKLARNALVELGVSLDSGGQKIEWKFITLLHKEQMLLLLKLSNLISGKHI